MRYINKTTQANVHSILFCVRLKFRHSIIIDIFLRFWTFEFYNSTFRYMPCVSLRMFGNNAFEYVVLELCMYLFAFGFNGKRTMHKNEIHQMFNTAWQKPHYTHTHACIHIYMRRIEKRRVEKWDHICLDKKSNFILYLFRIKSTSYNGCLF